MKVKVTLDTFIADRMMYRPYAPLFNTGGKWAVEVDVKEVRKEGDMFIFTPAGLEEAIGKVAEIFDHVHREYLAKVRNIDEE